jgi:ribosome-binding protein aMBF1 (putative translation factor)
MLMAMKDNKEMDTFSDYMDEEAGVSPAEKELIDFEVSLIGTMMEAREQKGLSRSDLAEMSGVKLPVIAQLESLELEAGPQVAPLFKVLYPLGYTVKIVPLQHD